MQTIPNTNNLIRENVLPQVVFIALDLFLILNSGYIEHESVKQNIFHMQLNSTELILTEKTKRATG